MPIFDDLRSAWGAVEVPASDLTPIDPATRTEFVVHWEGSNLPDLTDHEACFALMRSIQRYHMQTRGWADIGYNGTICPHSRSIEARGVDVQGAHATAHNATGYGWCFLVDLVVPPTNEMYARMADVEAACEDHSGHTLAKHGHRDVASTDCPGDVIEVWVKAGMPNPFPPPQTQETLWIDYSWARPDTTGFSGVVRYLEAPEKGTRPDLTVVEADSIHAKGLPIGLYWQSSDASVTKGYDVGIGQAWRANREADALRVPMHVPIFYVVDADYSPEQVQPYFNGVREFLDGRPIGIYGSYRIVEWARFTMGIEYAVQTSSWSTVNGVTQVSANINLYQRKHDLNTGTGAYDELLLVNPFPAWEPGQVLEAEPMPEYATKEQVAGLTEVIVGNHQREMDSLREKTDAIQLSINYVPKATALETLDGLTGRTLRFD
jgi:hypothetical protein